ncbi:MAG: alpha/beta fold hydrolase [Cyanothece sp. SIO1E1]|nr:alpha/beta fold hydrolase [Cyanothece sp. SIO1E1]
MSLYDERIDTFPTTEGGSMLVEAGLLGVLEDRNRVAGRRISIAYRRFKTTNPKPGHPIFMLAGGPGSSWIESLHNDERLKEVRFYQQFSDVIVFDQRGAGASIPNLACEGRKRVSHEAPFFFELLRPALTELTAECQEKWKAEGVDLSAYNTDENAADVDALRQVLGYEKMILIGGSYGSHLGLHVMRRFPERVDRVIFYGVEGPDHTWDNPTGLWHTLGRIAKAAEASAYYAGKVPEGGLLQALRTVIGRMTNKPIPYTLERKGKKYEVSITKELIQAIATFRAGKRSQPEVWPDLILAMYRGDYQLPAMASMGIRAVPAPHAMAKSMDFASGMSKTRRIKLENDPAREYLGDINWDYTLLEDQWEVKDLGDQFRSTVYSDIPTLLVHGTWDTSTPLENAKEVLAGLSQGQLIQVVGGGHGALYNLYEHWPAIYPLLEKFVKGKPVDFPKEVDLGPVSYPALNKSANAQLWDAAIAGDVELVKQALAAGAEIDALDTRRSKTGRRAMNWAAYHNHTTVLRFLIEQGAQINATNQSGFTPLHHAVERNAMDAVQLLLAAGADKSIRNKRGQLPIDTARRLERVKMIPLLED